MSMSEDKAVDQSAAAAVAATPQEKKNPFEGLARGRLEMLFDEGTFEEIGSGVVNRSTDFGLEKKRIPGDGVITGSGEVNGRVVFAYSQDRSVMGGSLGEAHAKKIARIQDLAMRAKAPLVGINDSGGARIQEGIDSLGGYGEIFRRNVLSSGVCPQISMVLGPCAGGAVYSPALTDFIVMVRKQSYMFLTGPKVVKTVTFEEVDAESLGGADVHGRTSGIAHLVYKNDEAAIAGVRELLSYLPQSYLEKPPFEEIDDPIDRDCSDLDTAIPEYSKQIYNVKTIVKSIFDKETFFEIQKNWAKNIVVGFARLGGYSVGVIANQPGMMAGVLDCNASRKAARFIRTCNSFNIPIISLIDVPGFLPGTGQEHNGVIAHGAKLMYAYCEATVPKIAVIMRKAYGGAYIVMSSKHVGADVNLAWPTAEVAVMGAAGAVEVLFRKEITQAEDQEQATVEKMEEYENKFLNPARAMERGYVDAVIQPSETRVKLFRHLKSHFNKIEDKPERRNGNIPT
ncbi:MAG: acyl-CoA carboxylase subunit beta [Deltaproteobacteria bacterium]|nr:acyl-CoA carboxylase subunit beta [Deltaproteobacteria bacterium]MBN2671658.1 acyl-CoA carboxylase subunit beta [Deltaproteobacteria bacterium]